MSKILEAYVELLEAVVYKAAALRNEAMLRIGDSPRAAQAVDEYDSVRSMVVLKGLGHRPKEGRPTSVVVGEVEVVLARDKDGAWLETRPLRS